jgi:glycosyltransferase involved in cell wall biosynthesis
LGYVDRGFLYSLLRDASALIIPSTWPENNPLIALEALSCGTPVIASDKGGLPEIVNKIDEGLVYKRNDELRRIILSFERKKYPPDTVTAVYRDHYSPTSYLKRYFELIDGKQSDRMLNASSESADRTHMNSNQQRLGAP